MQVIDLQDGTNVFDGNLPERQLELHRYPDSSRLIRQVSPSSAAVARQLNASKGAKVRMDIRSPVLQEKQKGECEASFGQFDTDGEPSPEYSKLDPAALEGLQSLEGRIDRSRSYDFEEYMEKKADGKSRSREYSAAGEPMPAISILLNDAGGRQTQRSNDGAAPLVPLALLALDAPLVLHPSSSYQPPYKARKQMLKKPVQATGRQGQAGKLYPSSNIMPALRLPESLARKGLNSLSPGQEPEQALSLNSIIQQKQERSLLVSPHAKVGGSGYVPKRVFVFGEPFSREGSDSKRED